MAWFQVSFFSVSMGRGVPLQVLLPDGPGAPAEGEKYKTLYLLHGYFGCCSDWLLNSPITELSQKYRAAVVMPSGDNGFYVDQPRSGVRGGEFIGRELVDFTRKLFPLSHEREDTLLAGLSMGGYGTLRNVLKYSGVFGHGIALSSAMGADFAKTATDEPNPMGANRGYYERLFGDISKIEESDNNLRKLAKDLLASGEALPDLYFACGWNDMLSGDNRAFHEYLDSISFPHTYEEGPGSHEWAFWNRFLERGLSHALGAPADVFQNPFFVDNYDARYDVTGQGCKKEEK